MARSIKLVDAFGRLRASALALAAAVLMFAGACNAATTIGQIADVEGALPKELLGFGVVFGLKGTGDTGETCPMTAQTRQTLARLGVQLHNQGLSTTKDVAFVWVRSKVYNLNQGSSFDVSVESVCGAKTIIGGRLVPTALIGIDDQVYAVGKGSVDVVDAKAVDSRLSSKSLGDDAAKPASGRIVGGAFIEQPTSSPLHLNLHDPDLATAMCVAAAINTAHTGIAWVQSARLVLVKAPASAPMDGFIHDLKQLNFASHGACARTPAAQAG